MKLLHGDCLELMKDIPDKSVDMVLCDLPYGTTACKWDTVIPFKPLWEQYERIVRANGYIVLFGSQPFTDEAYPTSILEFSNRKEKSFHPTEKPVQLLEYLIKTYTNEGETVLDNCMGSGFNRCCL